MIMTFNLNRHIFIPQRDKEKKTTKKVLVRDEFEWDNNELGKVMGSFRQPGIFTMLYWLANDKKLFLNFIEY